MIRNIFVLLFMGIFTIGISQESTDQSTDKDRQQAKEEIEAYFQSKVLPEINKSHATLKSEMQAEDLELLEDLIEQKSAMKDARKERGGDLRESLPEDFSREEFKEALKKRKAEHSVERESFKEDVQYLMLKYKDNIKTQMELIKSQKESWRTDIEEIKSEHGIQSDRPKRKMSRKGNKSTMQDDLEKSKKKHMIKGKRKRAKGRKKSAVKFLLWDGGEQSAKNFSQIRAFRPRPEFETKAFPNPATEQLTIAFDLRDPQSSVIVELSALDGKLIHTQSFKDLDAGPQEVQLNLQGIEPGQYIYTLKGKALRSSSKFVIQ